MSEDLIYAWMYPSQVLYFELDYLLLVAISWNWKKNVVYILSIDLAAIFIVDIIAYVYLNLEEHSGGLQISIQDRNTIGTILIILNILLWWLLPLIDHIKGSKSEDTHSSNNDSNVDGNYYPYNNREEQKEEDDRRVPQIGIHLDYRRRNSHVMDNNEQRYSFEDEPNLDDEESINADEEDNSNVDEEENINVDEEENINEDQIIDRNNDQIDDNCLRKINCLLYQPYYSLRNKSWSIWITDFVSNDPLSVLPICHHTFHKEWAHEWLNIKKTWPVCRRELTKKDIDSEYSTNKMDVIGLVPKASSTQLN